MSHLPSCLRRALPLGLLLSAMAVAWAQAPLLLVLNKEENMLVVVDAASRKVLGRVPTGEGPHEMVVVGRLAVIANYGSRTPGNSLSVIDVQERKEVRRFDL